jgi:hypothetical protein
MFLRVAACLFAVVMSVWLCIAQQGDDCPKRTVINNGVCRDANGNDCSQRDSQTPVCYDFDPQYTEEAAKAKERCV